MNEKKTPTRIYIVTETIPGNPLPEERLVRATSQAQAIRHVVGQRFDARVASQDDMLALRHLDPMDATATQDTQATGDDHDRDE